MSEISVEQITEDEPFIQPELEIVDIEEKCNEHVETIDPFSLISELEKRFEVCIEYFSKKVKNVLTSIIKCLN
jgi:hypothetical protein